MKNLIKFAAFFLVMAGCGSQLVEFPLDAPDPGECNCDDSGSGGSFNPNATTNDGGMDAGAFAVDSATSTDDSSLPGIDSGPTPEVDADIPLVDAGVPPVVDAGTTEDAGVPPVIDAGKPGIDSGTDAGVCNEDECYKNLGECVSECVKTRCSKSKNACVIKCKAELKECREKHGEEDCDDNRCYHYDNDGKCHYHQDNDDDENTDDDKECREHHGHKTHHKDSCSHHNQ